MRSSPLPILKQQIDHVKSQLRNLGKRNAIDWQLATGFSNFDGGRFPHRYDLSNGSIAIHHRDGFPTSNRAKVLAQMSLEVSDPYLLHDLMMTTSDLISKNPLVQFRSYWVAPYFFSMASASDFFFCCCSLYFSTIALL